jgi:hypothetical protein
LIVLDLLKDSHVKVTLLSPGLAPRIFDDQMVSYFTNQQNSVIQTVSTVILFRRVNSTGVKHQILLNLNCNSDRVLSQKRIQIGWLDIILFDLLIPLDRISLGLRSSALAILGLVGILRLSRYMMSLNIVIDILEHSSLASHVTILLRTINDFLLRKPQMLIITIS